MREEKGTARRNPSFELLRMIAMFMVVMLHYLSRTDSLVRAGEAVTGVRIAGSILESLCIVAVDTYVLISGYFLVESGFKIRRLVLLLLQVLFYSLLIPAALVLLGIPVQGTGISTAACYFLPVSTEHYWFVSSYVLMYLFSPLLSAAAHRLSKRQLQITIALLMVFYCVIPSLSPVILSLDRYGYDAGWFCCLFLTAAYLRLYGLSGVTAEQARLRAQHELEVGAAQALPAWRFARVKIWSLRGRNRLLVYFLCAFLTFTATLVLSMAATRIPALTHFSTVPLHYNALFCFLGAVSLFGAFEKLLLREDRKAALIRRIAPLTFGVYLIHHHIDIRDRWIPWTRWMLGEPSGQPVVFALQAILTVLIVYGMCLLIDLIRSMVFAFIGRYLKGSRADRLIDWIDGKFS
ncbi:MAG: acyltransferase [Lachnospiraceae bacterium]|nr:acyltransferase [Lachnospiraceae bacterium]